MLKLQFFGAVGVSVLILLPGPLASQSSSTVRLTSGGPQCEVGFQGVRPGLPPGT
jgi:hypothetical protein